MIPIPIEETGLEVRPFAEYRVIVDARTPKEFDEDHIPGAVNFPVVDQDEFAAVGTLHRTDPHAAYRLGVGYALRRMSTQMDQLLPMLDATDRVLVYCFRGGKRSALWADNLRTIGFKVDVVRGGWKRYRRWVLASLQELPKAFQYRVISGPTGAGKTRLLHALEREGAQVLDLEAMARHRGSLLGDLPGVPQPSQKFFDTLVFQRLRTFRQDRPVWVEDESKRIGAVQMSDAMYEAITEGSMVRVDAPMNERVRLWHEDYGHFEADLPAMVARLTKLNELVGNAEIKHWQELAKAGQAAELFERLMTHHYDPAYARTARRHRPGYDALPVLQLESLSPQALQVHARSLLATGVDLPSVPRAQNGA